MRSVTSLKRKVVTVAALIATVALLAGCTGIPRLPDRDILQIEALLDAYETALYEADWEEFSKLLAAPVTIERVLRDDELGDDFDPDVVLPALREQLPEGTELDMELTDGGWLFTFSMEHPTQVPAALGESLVLGQFRGTFD